MDIKVTEVIGMCAIGTGLAKGPEVMRKQMSLLQKSVSLCEGM